MRQNQKDKLLLSAVASLDGMLSVAGKPVDAFSLRGRPPEERARILLARLYAAGKRGSTLLEIVITIKAATLELGPHGLPDWEPIQIAKMAKRLRGVSGSRLKRYDGTPYTWANGKIMEKFVAGEGGFMRIAGRKIVDRARRVVDAEVIEAVLALRRKL